MADAAGAAAALGGSTSAAPSSVPSSHGVVETLESGNAVLQTVQASEGGRALKLLQQRRKQHESLESAKEKIAQESKRRRLHDIGSKYGKSSTEALEEAFRQGTIGLVTADEFREKRRKMAEQIAAEQAAREKASSGAASVTAGSSVSSSKSSDARRAISKLSFAGDDDEEDEGNESEVSQTFNGSGGPDSEAPRESPTRVSEADAADIDSSAATSSSGVSSCSERKRRALGKDPTVDSSFLPDATRDASLEAEKARLTREFYAEQERIKGEKLEVTFSYWDGSGRRRMIEVTKGTSIGAFIAAARQQLEAEVPELRCISVENLMYVKEDLILPHHVTFYELIRDRARGKSGPLFCFDVHDDVRAVGDIRVEKNESHAGKLVERRWYERNKHIFPASRWEMYDPQKTYTTYTIHGNKDHSKVTQGDMP